MASGEVLEFLNQLTRAERIRLIAELERIAEHPVLAPGDRSRMDGRGRTHYLRFADHCVIEFWFDHGEKIVNVMKVGWQ